MILASRDLQSPAAGNKDKYSDPSITRTKVQLSLEMEKKPSLHSSIGETVLNVPDSKEEEPLRIIADQWGARCTSLCPTPAVAESDYQQRSSQQIPCDLGATLEITDGTN